MACITSGKVHDSKIAKSLSFPKGSAVVFDNAYINFEWLKDLDSNRIYFVTRAKDNMNYNILSEFEIEARNKDSVLEDLDVTLNGFYSLNKYSGKLRLVRYYDQETDRELVFMTNNLSWTATTVAEMTMASIQFNYVYTG